MSDYWVLIFCPYGSIYEIFDVNRSSFCLLFCKVWELSNVIIFL